ncbi:MAG: pirin family protein [Actinobacteria bacterium]|nr:MAG: pirin family protein [Actinomycetota bacterium]
MIQIRRDAEIYEKEGGWFHARWHFSFDEYLDPEWMQFGSLRVFNDDRLVPGVAWPMHPHRDIEGITYVVEGFFQHADSLRGDDYPVLPAGSVQRMTLGAGAWHSEQNASDTEPMRFIQLWIMPRELGLEPSVEQRVLTKEDRTGRLLRAVSPEGGDAVLVHQEASVYVSALPRGTSVSHKFDDGTGGYLYVIGGDIRLNGQRLGTGDAAKIWDEPELTIGADGETELLLVEVRLDG